MYVTFFFLLLYRDIKEIIMIELTVGEGGGGKCEMCTIINIQ